MKADLVLITKVDLLPHLPDVRVERIVDALGHVMPRPRYLPVSGRTGEGLDHWLAWLQTLRRPSAPRGPRTDAHSHEPAERQSRV